MNIPEEAMAMASYAMREVTPPPGVDRSDWIKEHGPFALLAGAVAAAAPYLMAQALCDAADHIMGPSDVPLDAATCRWNAMGLRERAAHLNPSRANE